MAFALVRHGPKSNLFSAGGRRLPERRPSPGPSSSRTCTTHSPPSSTSDPHVRPQARHTGRTTTPVFPRSWSAPHVCSERKPVSLHVPVIGWPSLDKRVRAWANITVDAHIPLTPRAPVWPRAGPFTACVEAVAAIDIVHCCTTVWLPKKGIRCTPTVAEHFLGR